MKNLSPVSALLAGLLGVVGGVAVAACSNDATGEVPDGSPGDAVADHSVKVDAHDAGKDVNHPDVVVVNETGTNDTGPETGPDAGDAGDSGQDAPTEASTHDTGPDAPFDAPLDATHDAPSDAHDASLDAPFPDAGSDAPPAAVEFLALATKAYCEHAATCCVGDASADFDTAKCESDALADKYVPLTNLGIAYDGLGSPNATFVQSNANACIAAIQGLNCAVNSATTLATIVSTCASAYTPKLATGAHGCLSSFDCAVGNFCGPINLDAEGVSQPPVGGGTCTPLVALGSPCADTYNSSDCSYESGGTPAAYCFPATAGGTPVCQAAETSGSDCSQTYLSQECISGQCQPSGASAYTCQDSAIYTVLFGNNICALYHQ